MRARATSYGSVQESGAIVGRKDGTEFGRREGSVREGEVVTKMKGTQVEGGSGGGGE